MAGKISEKQIALLVVLLVVGIVLLGGIAPQAIPSAPAKLGGAGGLVQLVVERHPTQIASGLVTLTVSPAS